jgi:methanogen homoisocitrate dehydrogenase
MEEAAMKVAVVEGDGIGREVIPVARRVLETIRPDFEFFPVEVGYGRWARTGCACDADDIAALKSADTILFGAITTPPDPDYNSILLRIRKELDLYANVRPVRGEGFDILIIRENTEGLYSGIEWREEDRACTVRVITVKGSRRIAKFAAEQARKREGHLTIGNKANVLKSDVLFREICIEEATDTGVKWDAAFIDALTLDVLMHPAQYDVIVTTNMFGDILSDAAGYLVGGLGLLPSANIGDRHALFEPVHGSAPDIAGTNRANPVAAVRSAAMLLDHAGDHEGAVRIEKAILDVLVGGIRTPDMGGSAGTRAFGDALLQALQVPKQP